VVERVREEMARETGQEPVIVTGRYDTSSSLAFYLPGHPFVYSIMSQVGGRQSQYDLWPGLDERMNGRLKYQGRDMVIVGDFSREAVDKVLRQAFERLE